MRWEARMGSDEGGSGDISRVRALGKSTQVVMARSMTGE